MKKILQRTMGAFVLLMSLASTTLLTAQENTTAVGSGIVLPLLGELATASESGVTIEATVTGTSAGLAAFCSGEAPVAGATRPLTAEEEDACEANDVDFMELLIGQYVMALIGHPADDFYTCLSASALNQIFAPATGSQTTNWAQITLDAGAASPDLALTAAVVRDDTPAFALLDAQISGDGIRPDAIRGEAEAIVNAVGGTPGAVGVVDLESALVSADRVKLINLDPQRDTPGCITPSAGNAESGLYPLAYPLYVYVNRTQADALAPLLAFFATADFSAAVTTAGYTAPLAATLTTNQSIIAGDLTGRVYSRESVSYEIPPVLEGAVIIGGSGNQLQFYQSVATSLTEQYPNASITFEMQGDAAGYRRLCNGELDMVIATRDLTADETAACEANNIVPLVQPAGTQAVVLVGHEGDNFSLCLTQEQIITIWSAAATDTIENWQDVSDAFPDQAMTLFGIREGNYVTDILLQRPGESVLPVRLDTEINFDPLYRAAATANVPGALTYMTWSDYQRVVNNNQAGIQLVAVDDGNGCVQPTEETIRDGSYPLVQSGQMVISRRSLTNEAFKAYLWSLFTLENFSRLQANGLLGLDFDALPDTRDTLMAAFDEAAAAAAAAPEITPEPENTPEATPEAGG